jgi:hypothetical protein
VRDGLEIAFMSDQRDPNFGTVEKGTLMKKFDGVVSEDSSIASLDCRSSMCRMQTRHKDKAAFKKFVDGAFLGDNHAYAGAAHGALLSDPSGEGPVDAVVFLGRDGHGLPEIQPE